MAELATLRTAKVAFNEGLITQEDFDVVKNAFLKASQIKAGLDAGFIREEDYEHARDSFLHSMAFATSGNTGGNGNSSNGNSSGGGAPPPAGPVPPRHVASTSNLASAAAAMPAVARFMTPPRGGSVAAPPPPQQHRMAPVSASVSAPQANGQVPFPAPPQAQPSTSGAGLTGLAEIPTDLSRFQRGQSAVGKKSMAGIGLSDQAVAIFNCIKTKAAYKWVTFKIDDAGHEVVIDLLGTQLSTFEEFVGALPTSQVRYGVYDYAYTNADTGSTVNKLVFIHWAPDSSSTRSKMMYASTKDFFKGFLDGIGAELQATEVSELSDAEMRDRVGQAITRK